MSGRREQSPRDGIPWGPSGETVYKRTYRRTSPDGSPETWPETIHRVVQGNLDLVPARHHEPNEYARLSDLFLRFAALPAGRHLWMSGVSGRQFLFNCHVAGWDEAEPSAHFRFTFDQLMQGGGVGTNYSRRFLDRVPPVGGHVDLHLVCDPEHADSAEMAPWLSSTYSWSWPGSIRVEDSRRGWCDALASLLEGFWGPVPAGPLVLDLSLLRARGEPIRTFGGAASGPAPLARLMRTVADYMNSRTGRRLSSLDLMGIDHWIAEAVVAGNVRRSARMSIKHWADDDVLEFIESKRDPMLHWSTNISVEIDDDFFAALDSGESRATGVLRAVVKGMLRNGEPGLWNRALSSVGERASVVATNPCGEIALEEWENCNLGHVNLGAFVGDDDGAVEAHRLITRFLLRATFGDVPDPRQAAVLARNRRIGVGHFGYHAWVVKSGVRFSQSHRDPHVVASLRRFRDAVQTEASHYAAVLGVARPVKATTVAPTGTIAKLAGATEGIQPIYARYFLRRIRYADGDPELAALAAAGYAVEQDLYSAGTSVVVIPTKDLLVDEVGHGDCAPDADHGLVETADEIELDDLLEVQAMYQENYADNAVAITCNLPPRKCDAAAVEASLRRVLHRLKGVTLMVDDSRPQAPYERIDRDTYERAGSRSVDAAGTSCVGDVCPVGNEHIV